MTEERNVAGIRCTQVLEKLESYVAGELPCEDRDQIDAHLAGCSWCAEFGGRYAQTVALIRTSQRAANDDAEDAIQRALNAANLPEE